MVKMTKKIYQVADQCFVGHWYHKCQSIGPLQIDGSFERELEAHVPLVREQFHCKTRQNRHFFLLRKKK